MGSDIGRWLLDVSANILDLGSDIGGWFGDLGNDIGSWFGNLFSSIGDFSKSVGDWFADLFSGLGDWFADLFGQLGQVLNYINPFSDKFLLYIAFVPDDDFLENELSNLKSSVDERLAFISQISDAFKEVTNAISSNQWKGIKATIPFLNKEVTVVSPVFVEFAANKMKAWIGGLIVIILFAYLIKQGARVIGAGKG